MKIVNQPALRLLTLDPVKDSRWDKFVENHPLGDIYHLSGWTDFIQNTFKHIRWAGLSLVDDNENIRAVMPLYEIKSWLTGKRLVAAPFATYCDPLLTDPGQLDLFLDKMIGRLQEIGGSYLEIKALRPGLADIRPDLGENKYYKFHFLNLERPLDNLWKKFDRSCVRQRITRAEKSGFSIAAGDSESDLRDFHRLMTVTRERRSLPPQPFKFLLSLWHSFRKSGRIRLLLAKKDGCPAAGLLLLMARDMVTAEYAASDTKFKAMSPNHLLFWEAIKSAHQDKYRTFSFGRTSPENQGLLEFKRRWGTEEIELPYYYFPMAVARDARFQEGGKARHLAEAFLSAGISRPFRGLAASLIYRHLG